MIQHKVETIGGSLCFGLSYDKVGIEQCWNLKETLPSRPLSLTLPVRRIRMKRINVKTMRSVTQGYEDVEGGAFMYKAQYTGSGEFCRLALMESSLIGKDAIHEYTGC
jgi:hypothetical protein